MNALKAALRTLVALTTLLVCLNSIQGFAENSAADISAISKAAVQGDAEAQNILALRYYYGDGVPEDDAEAVKWFRRAAEQGDAESQYNLGTCYENGHGVPLDINEAAKWYRLAADQGLPQAQNDLGVFYESGRGVSQHYAESAKWYRLAAEQGDSLAQRNLALCYDNGRGVPKDYAEAVKWHRLAAEQGDPIAQSCLGWCYESGEGVPQDYGEAVKWYRLAAEQGDPTAQNNLGAWYEVGRGVPQDHEEAVKWYRLAAEQGEAIAQNNLGKAYGKGSGVQQDIVLAYMWFNLASASGSKTADRERKKVSKRMTSEQIAEAQKLSRDWKPRSEETVMQLRRAASTASPITKSHEPGHRGIVLAEGDVGKGTGFFANQNGKTYIYSNAHVFSGNKAMKFTSVSGEIVNCKTFEVSATADMVRFSIAGDYPAYDVMELVDQSVDLGDEVYVLGNSQGEGTITKLVGKVTGIGPEKIEVDAPFVSGNSGSPVIHASTGQVIGIATYAVRRKVDWTTKGTPFSSARRFAVRIDTATRWESPTWDRFVKEAQALRDFESTNVLLACFSAYYSGDLESPIELYEDLLKQHGLVESRWLPEVRYYDHLRWDKVRRASEDMNRYRKEHFCNWHQAEFLEHLKWREEIRKSLNWKLY